MEFAFQLLLINRQACLYKLHATIREMLYYLHLPATIVLVTKRNDIPLMSTESCPCVERQHFLTRMVTAKS